ncbi:MAG: RNA-guided endonuclease IscB [Candidatus Hydromicrobium sp.]|nr:RNA-guided endonuclease IscB [Candidatus Hydromicrobium sp.]
MQKLKERNTYTPTVIPQDCSNCGLSLNSPFEVRDSVASLKTSFNSSDAALTAREQAGQNLRVSVVNVLNKRGVPLMPCKPQKARRLLKEGRAKVLERTPFTIQLLYTTGESKQNLTLGVDAGYSNVGLSVVSADKELYSAELKLRTDMVKLNSERATYRRTRRSRKTWYRKARFLNRKKSQGWLAPSIQNKLDTHLKIIERIRSILPISNVVIEVAAFDTQKIQNPEITGVEYQQGELVGYEIREYLLEKWKRKCAYCGEKDIPLEIEHIIPKSRGGSSRISNLTISCNKCNLKKGNKTAEEFGHQEIQKQAKESLRATVFMNNVRWKLVNLLGCKWTYGYITKHNRIKLGLKKSHSNDAFIIAGVQHKKETIKYFGLNRLENVIGNFLKGKEVILKILHRGSLKGFNVLTKCFGKILNALSLEEEVQDTLILEC